MAIALYKYYDDANREYQVSLPDEFAVALSYEPAEATDPYLPRSISPRYCAYWNQSANLYRAVVIPNLSSFIAPPQTVTADGLDWILSGFYGEAFQQLPGGNMVVLSGVQGERGPEFDMDWLGSNLNADVAINSINTDFELCSITPTVGGLYQIFGQIQLQTGAAATRWTGSIKIAGSATLSTMSVHGATASSWYECFLHDLRTLSAGTAYALAVQATTNSTSARANSAVLGAAATFLRAYRIG